MLRFVNLFSLDSGHTDTHSLKKGKNRKNRWPSNSNSQSAHPSRQLQTVGICASFCQQPELSKLGIETSLQELPRPLIGARFLTTYPVLEIRLSRLEGQNKRIVNLWLSFVRVLKSYLFEIIYKITIYFDAFLKIHSWWWKTFHSFSW